MAAGLSVSASRERTPIPENRPLRRTVVTTEFPHSGLVQIEKCGAPHFSMEPVVRHFNALQNYGSSKGPVLYYVFDVLTISGHDVTSEPLSWRGRCKQRRAAWHIKPQF
jgi:hypothetical protein